jgi:hypothetical protein
MDELEIKLVLQLSVPKDGLTVNGIFQGLEEQTPELLSTLTQGIFQALEERAVQTLMESDPGRYRKNGHQSTSRQMKTFFGTVCYRLRQMIDNQTGQAIFPLAQTLDLLPYRRYQPGALEPGVGLVMHLSYRQASSEGQRIQGHGPSKSTLHRAVQELAERLGKWPYFKQRPFRFLMVDGTKVHLQGSKGKDLGQVEMRWALASVGPGKPFEPVGFWIGKGWATIRQDLEKRLAYQKIEVLFSDGGPGVEENLMASGMRLQRCLWHGKRDFPFILYQEGLKKTQQEPFKDLLKAIPAFGLTDPRLEQIDSQDYSQVKKLAQQTKQRFEDLLKTLNAKKYPKAHTYLDNLYQHTMTFFDYFLEKKKWIPLTTNAIESAFSRVTNRIKQVGKRWSDQGLLNWLMLALRKIFKPKLWSKLWSQFLKINQKMQLSTLTVAYQWL